MQSFTVGPNTLTAVCSHCFEPPKPDQRLFECACKAALYCNQVCQRGHRKTHKSLCPTHTLKERGKFENVPLSTVAAEGRGGTTIRNVEAIFKKAVDTAVVSEKVKCPNFWKTQALVITFNAGTLERSGEEPINLQFDAKVEYDVTLLDPEKYPYEKHREVIQAATPALKRSDILPIILLAEEAFWIFNPAFAQAIQATVALKVDQRFPNQNAFTVYKDRFTFVCFNKDCLHPFEKTQKIFNCLCKAALYCGKECQKADWSKHKHICCYPKEKQTINSAPKVLNLPVWDNNPLFPVVNTYVSGLLTMPAAQMLQLPTRKNFHFELVQGANFGSGHGTIKPQLFMNQLPGRKTVNALVSGTQTQQKTFHKILASYKKDGMTAFVYYVDNVTSSEEGVAEAAKVHPDFFKEHHAIVPLKVEHLTQETVS